MKKLILTLTLISSLAVIGLAQQRPLLMQHPALNKTHIVFSYAGDLWSVPRAGGEATRLTTGVGVESNPEFSPDGQTIAFTGEYDGNTDVYTIPASGGVPKRVTYHPAQDGVVGWTPDGKRILFASTRDSFSFFVQLYTIEPDGKFPQAVPLPMAEFGSFSPDGARIAYEPIAQWQPDWKRYRGGQTDRIWIAQLSDSSIEKIPQQDNSNDRNPVWPAFGNADKVFFLSDRAEHGVRSRDVEDAALGLFQVPGPLLHVVGQPPVNTPTAPSLGEHNADVLSRHLGLAAAEIAVLEGDGVLRRDVG